MAYDAWKQSLSTTSRGIWKQNIYRSRDTRIKRARKGENRDKDRDRTRPKHRQRYRDRHDRRQRQRYRDEHEQKKDRQRYRDRRDQKDKQRYRDRRDHKHRHLFFFFRINAPEGRQNYSLEQGFRKPLRNRSPKETADKQSTGS